MTDSHDGCVHRREAPLSINDPFHAKFHERAGVSSGRGGFRTCDLSRVKKEEDADPEAEGEP